MDPLRIECTSFGDSSYWASECSLAMKLAECSSEGRCGHTVAEIAALLTSGGANLCLVIPKKQRFAVNHGTPGGPLR